MQKWATQAINPRCQHMDHPQRGQVQPQRQRQKPVDALGVQRGSVLDSARNAACCFRFFQLQIARLFRVTRGETESKQREAHILAGDPKSLALAKSLTPIQKTKKSQAN